MKRNKQEERLKELGRLDTEMYHLDTGLDWIPVEESQFLGWEFQVLLSQSGLRRRDAEDLLEVMRICDVSEVNFTKYEWVVKLIKSQGGRYYQAKEGFFKRWYKGKKCYRSWHTDEWIKKHYFPYWENNSIDEKSYEQVQPRLKKYFDRVKHSATVWRPEYYRYRINLLFPKYELIIKCTKAYSTHKGIPHGEEIARYDQIHATLMSNHYWCAQNCFSRWRGMVSSWERRYNRKLTRRHWRSCLQEVGKIKFNPWYWECEGEDSWELLEKEEKRLLGYSRVIKN